MTRNELLVEAVDKCMKEIYSWATPKVTWEQFMGENKEYNSKFSKWENFHQAENNKNNDWKRWQEQLLQYPEWEGKSQEECIGPKPFEFYYIPKEILTNICDSYIDVYQMDHQQNLLDIIDILKRYCVEPIVTKYVDSYKDETGYHPGYRSYDHPNNLKKELRKIFDNTILPDICRQYNKQYNLQTTGIESSVSIAYSQVFQDKFFEFLDMAGKFYNWNSELNSFKTTIYLGASPSSNKEAVIDNWKKYRNKDIEINDEKIKELYYDF